MPDTAILRELAADPPKLFPLENGEQVAYAISVSLLEFLNETLTPGMETLETGAGVSTILFALRGTRHTAIAPSTGLGENIAAYLKDHAIDSGTLNYISERSETVLPALEATPLDVVLIDGRHAFPSPMIDWYYTAERLKVGGLVIVDDIPLWPPRMLHNFLLGEPEWEHVTTLEQRSSVFRKIAEGSNNKMFLSQPYTVSQSKSRRANILGAAEMILKGRFDTLNTVLQRRKHRRN